jgi:hypothetical protein
MKVYEISTLAKPPRGNFESYAPLTMGYEQRMKLGAEVFTGNPFPSRWKPLNLYLEKPKWPKPDFYSLGSRVFVCNQRICDLVGESLVEAGEFLPVSIEGESEQFFIYNITNCIPVFDPEKSVWKYFGPNNSSKHLVTPAFLSQRFGEESVFKFPDVGGATMYCLERTGDADDGEFKALVARHKLTGIDFKLVWESKDND